MQSNTLKTVELFCDTSCLRGFLLLAKNAYPGLVTPLLGTGLVHSSGSPLTFLSPIISQVLLLLNCICWILPKPLWSLELFLHYRKLSTGCKPLLSHYPLSGRMQFNKEHQDPKIISDRRHQHTGWFTPWRIRGNDKVAWKAESSGEHRDLSTTLPSRNLRCDRKFRTRLESDDWT